MEFLFEILLELLLEGTLEISKKEHVPKIIRYPLIFLLFLFFLSVDLIIFFTGVLAYQKINKICGIFFFLLGINFLVMSFLKFKKIYGKKYKK